MPLIGLGLPLSAPDVEADTALMFGQRAEEVGLHSVWAIDRIVLSNQDALMALAAVAGATRTVRLGTSVLLGTLHRPLQLAKAVATLDCISNGRAILGLGVGSRRDDFDAAEVPFERRGPRLSEHIQVMQEAWSGKPVEHTGAFYDYHLGSVGPRPVQQPHPPIWLGGSAEAALRRAGRLGSGYIGGASRGPEGLANNLRQVRQFAEAAGRDPQGITAAALVFCSVDEDRSRALEVAGRYMLHYYGARRPGMSAEELVGPHHLVGPADDCVRKAEEYFAAGVDVLIVAPMTSAVGNLDRLCAEVLPRLDN